MPPRWGRSAAKAFARCEPNWRQIDPSHPSDFVAVWPSYEHLIFGIVSAASYFFPGLKYFRQQRDKTFQQST